jgi:hypothetical protein
MMDLFGLETVVKQEVLMSEAQTQELTLSIKDTTGLFRYQVCIETGLAGRIHGKQSHSFQYLDIAEERFAELLSQYQEEGYEMLMIA